MENKAEIHTIVITRAAMHCLLTCQCLTSCYRKGVKASSSKTWQNQNNTAIFKNLNVKIYVNGAWL